MSRRGFESDFSVFVAAAMRPWLRRTVGGRAGRFGNATGGRSSFGREEVDLSRPALAGMLFGLAFSRWNATYEDDLAAAAARVRARSEPFRLSEPLQIV